LIVEFVQQRGQNLKENYGIFRANIDEKKTSNKKQKN